MTLVQQIYDAVAVHGRLTTFEICDRIGYADASRISTLCCTLRRRGVLRTETTLPMVGRRSMTVWAVVQGADRPARARPAQAVRWCVACKRKHSQHASGRCRSCERASGAAVPTTFEADAERVARQKAKIDSLRAEINADREQPRRFIQADGRTFEVVW